MNFADIHNKPQPFEKIKGVRNFVSYIIEYLKGDSSRSSKE
jgi:hypothetical protein